MAYPRSPKMPLALIIVVVALAITSGSTVAAQQPPPRSASEDQFIYVPFVSDGSHGESAPVIKNFLATPPIVTSTGSSTLNWSVSGAMTLSVSGIGAVTGSSLTVKPVTTTTYILTASNTKGTTTAQTTVTVVASQISTPSGFFLQYLWNDQIWQSAQPRIAVDAAGGVHVAYGSRSGGAIFYAYCSADCTSLAHFQSVAMGGSGWGTVHLALDTTGRPRLIISDAAGSSQTYRYAECIMTGAGCTNLGNWRISAPLGTGEYSHSEVESSHPFVLDSQGHPRFVYSHWSVNGTDGTYLLSCEDDCTIENNWTQSTVSNAWWDNLNLTIAPQGLLRLAYVAQSDGVDHIFYLECTTINCSTFLGPLLIQDFQGKGVYAMRLDSMGRPRMAINPGWGKVFYFVCDINCASDNQQWTYLDIGLPEKATDGSVLEQGQLGIDLALDKTDQPHIAYHTSLVVGELGYAWCRAACRDSQPSWHNSIIASRNAADQELGYIRLRCDNCIPKLPDCESTWDVGYWPMLALDIDGNPRIVYESQLWSFGGCSAEAVARISRIVVLNRL